MTPEAKQLKSKLGEWRSWMESDDDHSISYQILGMLWDEACFRIVLGCRSLAPAAEEGRVELNGTVHGFINRCYLGRQALAIRRLIEHNPRKPNRDVISLQRLLDEISRHRPIFTRGNLFAAEGLRIDQVELPPHTDDPSWRTNFRSYSLNKTFDRLSEVDEGQCTPDDVLRRKLLESLHKRLKTCEDVYVYVSKYIAHAAHPDNRDAIQDHQTELCMQQINDCQKAICGVAAFVATHILDTSVSISLPTPQFDQFAYLEKPWIVAENFDKLLDFWRDFVKETEEWGNPNRVVDWKIEDGS